MDSVANLSFARISFIETTSTKTSHTQAITLTIEGFSLESTVRSPRYESKTYLTHISFLSENIFIPVKHASPIAKRMINEVRNNKSFRKVNAFLMSMTQCVRLPPYLRLGYITASVRGLMCRALVLIKYVEALTKNTATGGAAAGTVGARATLADGQNVGESDAQGSAPKSPNVTHHSATNVPPNAPHAETLPSDYNVPDTSAPNCTHTILYSLRLSDFSPFG